MKAFFQYLLVQFKMDIRERGTLLTYYAVPLVFYFIMGAVFSSINPTTRDTLAASMTIFAVTMGAVLGLPAPIVKIKETGVLRAYRVNGIPNGAVLLVQAVSAFMHLLLVSLIIFLSAPLLYSAGLPGNYGAYAIILVVLIFTSIGWGLLIGVISRSQAMATMLSQAVFLPSLMLSGIMFPASMLPGFLNKVGVVFPATHAMRSFSGLAFNVAQDYSGELALGILAFIGIVALCIAIWRFANIGSEA
jgi:ABC-2 type transport system permease protein